MRLYDLMKEYGIPAKDSKQRLANKQIKVNGVIRGGDYNLGSVTDVYDQGFFLEELYKLPNYSKLSNQIMFFGLENLFDSNISNELTDFLKDYKMIVVSKNNAVFVKVTNGNKDELNITYHLEGDSDFDRKFEPPKEVSQDEVLKKLRSDLEKVEKQLSNKSFVNNAPTFKVESAKKRSEVLKSKIDSIVKNERVYSFDRYSKLL